MTSVVGHRASPDLLTIAGTIYDTLAGRDGTALAAVRGPGAPDGPLPDSVRRQGGDRIQGCARPKETPFS